MRISDGSVPVASPNTNLVCSQGDTRRSVTVMFWAFRLVLGSQLQLSFDLHRYVEGKLR
jgi:hypothetical protein